MRALLVLIKRQVVDNAIYFAAAAAVSLVLMIAAISVGLTEDRTSLSPYAAALLLTVPVLFCIGSYALGLSQAYADRTSGIAAVLAVLPAAPGQTLVARLVVGVLVILTVSGPLAIVGFVLWKVLGPPPWLFHGWLADTFLGMTLTAFGCYCLGLHAGSSAETIARGLRALPLTIVLLLLIVTKGFGWPFLAVLVPYLGVSLLLHFKSFTGRFAGTAAMGFMVLTFLAIPLFLGRYLCDGLLVSKIDAEAKISPSGLLPPEIENDPNIEEHSEASSGVSLWRWDPRITHNILRSNYYDFYKRCYAGPFLLEESGIIKYFESREQGRRYIYDVTGIDIVPGLLRRVHFDKVAGQIVCHRKDTDSWYDRSSWHWREALVIYAGPEGVARNMDSSTGRFLSPVLYLYPGPPSLQFRPPPTVLTYDNKTRCFFAIDFEKQTVRKGPTLKDSSAQPINIGSPEESSLCNVSLHRPYIRYGISVGNVTNRGFLPVVRETGRIDLLDPNTLELLGPAGYLPRPKTLFGRGSSRPRDLLGYDIDLIVDITALEAPGKSSQPDLVEVEGAYLGVVVGSLSRDGTSTALAVFDKEGHIVKTAHSKGTLLDVPGGPVLATMKYLFESLHPPVLALASFFTAYSFEARSTHRALLLMPNSFVALARDRQGNIFWTLMLVLLLMLPALLLSGVLAWRVDRDAARLGLSHSARRLWLLGTLAFGLAGYITYRLSRPRVTLVTCTNCGYPRRPDMDKCHRCGSPWHVPELTPPAWRVLDSDVTKSGSEYQEIRVQGTRGPGHQEKPTPP